MGIISKISFRNLTRQKRRNILLGLGIGFGMSILVIATSFANGLGDVLINDLVTTVAGHVQISNRNKKGDVFRDKEAIYKVLEEHRDKIVEIDESVGTFTKIVGKGKSLSAPIVGVEDRGGFFGEYLTVLEGDVKDFSTDVYEWPIVLSPDKAKGLNVTVGDIVKARFETISGQVQAVNLQVIAIATTNSSFMDFVLYMDVNKMRQLLGYSEWESGPIQLTVKNPKVNAVIIADAIHKALEPKPLNVIGSVSDERVRVYAYNNDEESKEIIFQKLKVLEGDEKEYKSKTAVLISQGLKEALGIEVGDKIPFSYESKFYGTVYEDLKVDGIFEENEKFTRDLILVNGERVYRLLSEDIPNEKESDYFTQSDDFYKAIALEYKLLDRAPDAEKASRISRMERVYRSDRSKVKVSTMYETASQILKIEFALKVITWVVVSILFFIILIGVVNTLRMTVKERTREIGTLRAIGMQARDVKNSFILESIYLTVLACIGGAIIGWIISFGLGQITFEGSNPLSFVLKEKKIFFKFSFLETLIQGMILVVITIITAYFPSRKASKIKPSEALRHVE